MFSLQLADCLLSQSSFRQPWTALGAGDANEVRHGPLVCLCSECAGTHVLKARQPPVDLCSCAQAKLVILGSQTTLRSVPHFAQVRGLHT